MSNFDITVVIHAKDRKVAAMVKALAFEVDGPKSVEGASKEYLAAHGHLVFHFRTLEKAGDFRDALAMYLPGILGRISDP